MEEKRKRNQYEFDKKKYDHIHLQVPKGFKLDIQNHASSKGESVNAFINRAIKEAIERETQNHNKDKQ